MAKAKKTTSEKKDLTALDATELRAELLSARKEHFSLSMKHSLGELKQPHLLRKSRKNIAQLSTALSSTSL
jgi:large subunit ribosomal protein L29